MLLTTLEAWKTNWLLSVFINTLHCPERGISCFAPPWKSGKEPGYFLSLERLRTALEEVYPTSHRPRRFETKFGSF